MSNDTKMTNDVARRAAADALSEMERRFSGGVLSAFSLVIVGPDGNISHWAANEDGFALILTAATDIAHTVIVNAQLERSTGDT